MKCLTFIVIIFGSFFNVSLTWSQCVTNEIPSQVAFSRNEDTLDLDSSALEKICYDKFTPRVNYLRAEIKNGTEYCVNGAVLKIQIKEKLKQLQCLMAKCALELNHKKYFKCMNNIAADNKKISDEILLITKNFRTECLIANFERAKYRSSSALYDLNLCLRSINQSTLLTTTPNPNTDSPDELLNVLEKIELEYESLKSCLLDKLNFSMCMDQTGFTQEDLNSIDNLFGSSSEHFEILNKVDIDENSCQRQFIKLLINKSFKFDLEGCIKNGLDAVVLSEENEEKDIQLVRSIIKFHNSFNACRAISKNLFTYGCVKDLLRDNPVFEIQSEIAKRSEENYKKINIIINDLYIEHLPCIGDMVPILQFDSLNMYYDEKDDLENCLMQGYKLPSEQNKDDTLTTLKTIQDSIKGCTLHPDSPGLKGCYINYAAVYYDFKINFVDSELIDESDKTQHTCFRTILDQRLSFNDAKRELMEKCISV